MIPLIISPNCRPDLICQKLNYRECLDDNGDDCTKFSPGAVPMLPPTTDPYPICNAIPTLSSDPVFDPVPGNMDGYIDEMDCDNQPCTCRTLDYKYVWYQNADFNCQP